MQQLERTIRVLQSKVDAIDAERGEMVAAIAALRKLVGDAPPTQRRLGRRRRGGGGRRRARRARRTTRVREQTPAPAPADRREAIGVRAEAATRRRRILTELAKGTDLRTAQLLERLAPLLDEAGLAGDARVKAVQNALQILRSAGQVKRIANVWTITDEGRAALKGAAAA